MLIYIKEWIFQVFSEKILFPMREISLSEFQKTGRGLSSLCILVKKSKTIRKIWRATARHGAGGRKMEIFQEQSLAASKKFLHFSGIFA